MSLVTRVSVAFLVALQFGQMRPAISDSCQLGVDHYHFS